MKRRFEPELGPIVSITTHAAETDWLSRTVGGWRHSSPTILGLFAAALPIAHQGTCFLAAAARVKIMRVGICLQCWTVGAVQLRLCRRM